MINTVIIDDEQNNIDNLSILLQKYCAQVTILATALNADEGEQIILKHKPDLVFLDIQMPSKNGFDLLKSLKSFDFEIIFVTAYDQYGIQAVKFSAIDYLLKPINIDDLKDAVQKAALKSAQKKHNVQLENLIHLIQQKQEKQFHRIALQSTKETRFVEPNKILRCESSNNYTTFFLSDGEKILTSKPIFEYEDMLQDYGFVRCHQSHLVNKAYIKSWIKEEGGYLLMEDKAQIPISRHKKEGLKSILGQM
jgi:two-component system, LytTR family, response regulator